jgi:hypothetical protein
VAPDGLVVEFTAEPEDAAAIAAWQGDSAHDALARWVAGERSPNKDVRAT